MIFYFILFIQILWDAKLFLKSTRFNKTNIFTRMLRTKHDISRIQIIVSLVVSAVSIRATMAAYIIWMANILGGNSTRISHVPCTQYYTDRSDCIYVFQSRGLHITLPTHKTPIAASFGAAVLKKHYVVGKMGSRTFTF